MNHRMSLRARGLSAGLAAGVLVPLVATATPAAAAGQAGAPRTAPAVTAATTPQVACTSAKAGLAAKLQRDITAALANRKGTVAIGVYDRTTKTSCRLRSTTAFDSASVVKVTVLATLLWDAKKQNRYLTQREVDLTRAMITQSDNNATTALWRQLGMTKIKGFLAAADMTRTVPGADGYWGLTRINVGDEQKLLSLLTRKNTVLSDNARAYALKLMNQVVASQRWGTPAGAPSTVKVHVKNGWLPRATHGWRVHSVGAFQGGGHDYYMTVLTQDNATMDYGVATIQAVARVVHRDLVPSTTFLQRYEPTTRPAEVVPPLPAG
ncbi:serine hydrolase [Streptomyces sp. NPDC101118]|uniref:serine hydrolase n=1 Tax=Streptomyces sp. NPDC101118 TaxID=3366109 RepID=UPI0037F88957